MIAPKTIQPYELKLTLNCLKAKIIIMAITKFINHLLNVIKQDLFNNLIFEYITMSIILYKSANIVPIKTPYIPKKFTNIIDATKLMLETNPWGDFK